MTEKSRESHRVDHAGEINTISMHDKRRSSLIDQMAMVAISQQLLENLSEDSDPDLDEDGANTEGGDIQGGLEENEEELEMVFNTELDDATNEYETVSIPADQTDYGYEKMDAGITIVEENQTSRILSNRPSLSLRNRRTSYRSDGEGTFHSAPARQDVMAALGYESHSGSGAFPKTERRRPLSIAVPNAAGAESSRALGIQRRKTTRIKKSFTDSIDEGQAHTPIPSSNSGSLFGRFSTLGGRKNSMQDTTNSFDTAIERLRNQDSNSEWESVAAAVAVVQESEKRPTATTPRHNQFNVGDTVLVFLTLLNVTNLEDPKDAFTVSAVNKFGYPEGEGRTEEEKKGPHNFVLATVKQLHFEEDDRYYTVIRADTGSEQRSDSGWMEKLTHPLGIEAAARAAKRTFRSMSNEQVEVEDDTGFIQDILGCLLYVVSWPVYFVHSSILPGYRKARLRTKLRVAQMLYGDSPFACNLRFSGINFLVLCSLIFLFLEVANLAFLPSDIDKEIKIVGIVVWAILVMELILEVLIRPTGYAGLMESDKAFAPSTARHISTFHIFFEGIALLTFIPEFWCITDPMGIHSRDAMLSRVRASLDAILGENELDIARGRFILGLTALRFFGVVRHWKNMWINKTFKATDRRNAIESNNFGSAPTVASLRTDSERSIGNVAVLKRIRRKLKTDDDNESYHGDKGDDIYGANRSKGTSSEQEQRLKNAATIGTALMVVNSQRALILLTGIVLFLPLLLTITETNLVAPNLVSLLQANNLQQANSTADCAYLKSTVDSWLKLALVPQPASFVRSQEDTFVLWAQLLPKRCDWQREDGVITVCPDYLFKTNEIACRAWEKTAALLDIPPDLHFDKSADDDAYEDVASELHVRSGGLRFIEEHHNMFPEYCVHVLYNENVTISLANTGLFFLLLGILLLGLYSLTALRGDAIRLVLDPLQRMLKIVLQYAENPLSQNAVRAGSKRDDDYHDPDKDSEEIGNYETEQLINAITKIADLLRKCWGVAGAGIISSNLARTNDGKTVLFNPTVPGKRVYALFGFVAINGFSDQLRRLDRDVMILINDVAKVVHDEVYRWALGDHGQCNKNLGSAFLMVFRIGDFSEVHKKKKVATEKLFRSNKGNKKANVKQKNKLRQGRRSTVRSGRRSSRAGDDGQIVLASLPGIQGFTDRALLGMLKSFAGIHRDRNLYQWQNDFRLSDGVGSYCVDIIYGMDAGWAVEGAVGSEHKIDATYLSPHVNMASRMMSATKQYGVTILLSKAVEELLSKNCRKKLRHLDTVYVKGSNVKQDIFTYDARHQGVDFFLIERTPTQADIDAECYTPNIWDHDQDIKAMRHHISDEFMELFNQGLKQYLTGNWKSAYNLLEQADNKMIEVIIDEGYIEIDLDEYVGDIYDRNCKNEDIVRLRHDLGDDTCRVLMSYMKSYNLRAPLEWDGVRKLSSK